MGVSHVVTPGRHETAAASRAGAQEGALLHSGLVDRGAPTVEIGASVGQALELISAERLWGVPVVDRGAYVGTVTAASLIALSLPVTPDSLMPGAGLAWLPSDIRRLRRRLEDSGTLPVERALDIAVPTIRVSSSPAHLLLMLARRAPIVVVLEDDGGQFLGTASSERAARLLRSAA
jgi:CBS domain-containing protein